MATIHKDCLTPAHRVLICQWHGRNLQMADNRELQALLRLLHDKPTLCREHLDTRLLLRRAEAESARRNAARP